MRPLAAEQNTSAVEMFALRCEARSLLYAAGEMTLHDAVDGCQRHAEAYGLVGELGQDGVQEIIAAAFAVYAEMVPSLIDEPSEPQGVAASTIDACKYLMREGDSERLRTFLAKHSAQERTALQQHIRREAGRCRSRMSR